MSEHWQRLPGDRGCKPRRGGGGGELARGAAASPLSPKAKTDNLISERDRTSLHVALSGQAAASFTCTWLNSPSPAETQRDAAAAGVGGARDSEAAGPAKHKEGCGDEPLDRARAERQGPRGGQGGPQPSCCGIFPTYKHRSPDSGVTQPGDPLPAIKSAANKMRG